MSDLYLKPTSDGGEITIKNGDIETTSKLEVSAFLSLFTPPWWGNSISESEEKYNSRIPELMRGPLTNNTRLAIMRGAESALAWMISEGIAERIETEATIPSRGTLHLTVRVYEPQTEDPEEFAYGVNWDSQEVRVI